MNTPNPYSSPAAAIVDRGRPWERDVPDEITRPIKHGWVAALVSMAFTLIVTLFYLFGTEKSDIFNAWSFIDVGLIAVLAFGIYKRSRTAATITFFYFLSSKILIMIQTGQPSGIVTGLIFLIFYFRAMVATYRYHGFVKSWKRNPPAPKRPLSEDPLFAPKAPDTAA